MKRFVKLTMASLACLAVLAIAAPAKALVIAPAPIPQRVAMAEGIVVGKLGKVEEKNVSATPFPGTKDKVEYQVIALKIDEPLVGFKDKKEVRLGFIPPGAAGPVGGPIRRPGCGNPVFMTDQQGVFFLTKHHEGDFYVAPNYFDFIDKNANTYEKDLEQVKKCAKLLADPKAGLKAKDAEDRLFTASMLLTRYRSQKPNQTKQEPIEADESKLILTTILESEWNVKPAPGQAFFNLVQPRTLFYQLGLTDKDGWVPPKVIKTQNDFDEAAKAWLKDNADKYRIQRWVAEKKD